MVVIERLEVRKSLQAEAVVGIAKFVVSDRLCVNWKAAGAGMQMDDL